MRTNGRMHEKQDLKKQFCYCTGRTYEAEVAYKPYINNPEIKKPFRWTVVAEAA